MRYLHSPFYFRVANLPSRPKEYGASKHVELDLLPGIYRVYSRAFHQPVDLIRVELSRSDQATPYDYSITLPNEKRYCDLKLCYQAEEFGGLSPQTSREIANLLAHGTDVLVISAEKAYLLLAGEYSPPVRWPLRDLERRARVCVSVHRLWGYLAEGYLAKAYEAVRPN